MSALSSTQTLATDVVLAAGGGGSLLGSVGVSGLAFAAGFILFSGLRGSDRVKLDRDKAGVLGIVFSTLSASASGMWGALAAGAAEVPKGLMEGLSFGNFGLGAVALGSSLMIFIPKWKKLWMPAFLGVGAGWTFAGAGGIWALATTLVTTMATKLGGM
ncbi:hypothetical protein OS965_37235 [Streptomyces sp. H27-G5]|uniref:hypothetical protein n=1 Tax=Streptomyces sp. H27-G5 TaxID=2996698 RepID=UPI00227026EC|nr:hypothetical protein [Streptomyces sp. H27-G5]MCY0923726.1 hypothetical protein [Streptomyces sp. H27-G5]